MRITEKHKRAAAQILRGVRRVDIAKELGIDRRSLRNWERSPAFQALMDDVRAEIIAARAERIAPITVDAMEMLSESIAWHRQQKKKVPIPDCTRLVVALDWLMRSSIADALLAGAKLPRPETTSAKRAVAMAPEVPDAEDVLKRLAKAASRVDRPDRRKDNDE
jgi:hypothetical protein